MDWDKTFANDVTNKGLISKISNSSYSSISKTKTKTSNAIKKQSGDLNRHFSKEDI